MLGTEVGPFRQRPVQLAHRFCGNCFWGARAGRAGRARRQRTAGRAAVGHWPHDSGWATRSSRIARLLWEACDDWGCGSQASAWFSLDSTIPYSRFKRCPLPTRPKTDSDSAWDSAEGSFRARMIFPRERFCACGAYGVHMACIWCIWSASIHAFVQKHSGVLIDQTFATCCPVVLFSFAPFEPTCDSHQRCAQVWYIWGVSP